LPLKGNHAFQACALNHSAISPPVESGLNMGQNGRWRNGQLENAENAGNGEPGNLDRFGGDSMFGRGNEVIFARGIRAASADRAGFASREGGGANSGDFGP